MTRAPFSERAQRVIDLLSGRIDDQAMQRGADTPHCVSTVGTFHESAGRLERAIDRAGRRLSEANAMVWIRSLRRIVASHATMVADRAKFLASKGA